MTLQAVVRDNPRATECRQISFLSGVASLLRFRTDPLQEMQRIQSAYGNLCEFSYHVPGIIREHRYIFAVGAKYNARVLGNPDIFKSVSAVLPGPRHSAQRRFGTGLLGPSCPQQAHYRKALLPPLRRSSVDKLTPEMARIVADVSETWATGTEQDLFELCKQVIRKAVMKTLFPSPDGGDQHHVQLVAAIVDEHVNLDSSTPVRIFPVDVWGSPYRRLLKHADQVEGAIRNWIAVDGHQARGGNLMCILNQSPDETGGKPSEQTVYNYIPSLFGATFETTEVSLAWAMLLLVQHPDMAARTLDEVSGFPDDPDGFAQAAISNPWLQKVVRESLRVLPTGVAQLRRAAETTELVDCEIGKGSYVILSAFLTKRNPDLFPQPDLFRPDRWDHCAPSQYEYLSFSARPRTCIGAYFANSLLCIAIARLIGRFRIRAVPSSKIDYRFHITLKPGKQGIPVMLHDQDGAFAASPLSGRIVDLVAGLSGA